MEPKPVVQKGPVFTVTTVTADYVREVLKRFQLDHPISETWHKELDVPPGVSTEIWILNLVANTEKLDLRKLLPKDVWNRFQSGVSPSMNIVCPEVVTTKPERFPTGSLVNKECIADKSIAGNVWTYKIKFPVTKQEVDQVLFPLSSKLNLSNILYHGDHYNLNVLRNIFRGIDFDPGHENEFGTGFYTTSDFNYALSFTGPDGCLQLFDWSDEGGKLIRPWRLTDSTWSKTVVGNLLFPQYTPPNRENFDILTGPVTKNHDAIIRGDSPIPHETLSQVVGISPAGFEAFGKRLVAVIMMTTKNKVPTTWEAREESPVKVDLDKDAYPSLPPDVKSPDEVPKFCMRSIRGRCGLSKDGEEALTPLFDKGLVGYGTSPSNKLMVYGPDPAIQYDVMTILFPVFSATSLLDVSVSNLSRPVVKLNLKSILGKFLLGPLVQDVLEAHGITALVHGNCGEAVDDRHERFLILYHEPRKALHWLLEVLGCFVLMKVDGIVLTEE